MNIYSLESQGPQQIQQERHFQVTLRPEYNKSIACLILWQECRVELNEGRKQKPIAV